MITFEEVKRIATESVDESKNMNELIQIVLNKIYQKGFNDALNLPPHGDLIERNGIKWIEEEFEERCHNDRWTVVEKIAYKAQVDKLPTIIPADGKGYILAPQEGYDGLKRKYVVLKSDSGEPVEDCFVLRPDKDKAAIAALLAYADTTDNQVLAKDIRAWISTIPAEEGDT